MRSATDQVHTIHVLVPVMRAQVQHLIDVMPAPLRGTLGPDLSRWPYELRGSAAALIGPVLLIAVDRFRQVGFIPTDGHLAASLVDEMHIAVSPRLLGAGLFFFAGLILAQMGFRPIIVDRGKIAADGPRDRILGALNRPKKAATA